MEKLGRKSVELPEGAAVAHWLDQLAAATGDRRYRHAASIVRAPPAGRPPCADDPLVTETHQTAQRDGWAFPTHYILIGPLQVIIGAANIRRDCRSRHPKEKMANPDARTSKRELG